MLAVFEYIKDSVDFAPGAIAYLQDSPEDLGMDVLYETVMEYAEYLKNKEDKEMQEKRYEFIQKTEKVTKKDREDADVLLTGLMDLI